MADKKELIALLKGITADVKEDRICGKTADNLETLLVYLKSPSGIEEAKLKFLVKQIQSLEASHKGPKQGLWKAVVSGVKSVPERINSDRVDSPPQQKQASPIEFQEMRRRELMEKRDAFVYLLEDTVLLIRGMESQRLTPDTMVVRWRNALENGDCAALAKEFDALCLESVDAPAVLQKWMEFLGHEGIEIVDGDMDTVTVSVENRRFYKNGPDFKDGARCAVISHSWLANGDIYYKGRLCPEEAEEDHGGR